MTRLQQALKNNIDIPIVLGQLRDARSKGLTAPVLLMGTVFRLSALTCRFISIVGYYNPILAYGEDKAIRDAAEVGANGFIMVDLPPEEALTFREKCAKAQ